MINGHFSALLQAKYANGLSWKKNV